MTEYPAKSMDRAGWSAPRPRGLPPSTLSGCTINVWPGEPIESALRRFKKATAAAGIGGDERKHEHYDKPSVRRKQKSAAARRRATA